MMKLLLLLSFLVHLVFAQDEIVEQVEITAPVDVARQPRSIDWPVVVSEAPPILNMPQVEDALNSLNGVQTRSQGSPTYSIRGSAQNGRALVLYNDIPLNFASGFGAPSVLLPKEVIQNIQVVKGPASLFYGSQAMAGSLNFQPQKYEQAEVSIVASDTNESFMPWREGKLAHNNVQLVTPIVSNSKTHIQASVFTENDDGQFPYQVRSGSGVRQFNAQNQSRAVLTGKTQWKNLKLSFDSIVGRQIRQSPGPTNFSLVTREETEGVLASVTPEYFINDKNLIRSRLSFMTTESEYLENNQVTFNNQATWISQNEYVYDLSSKMQLQVFADFFSHSLDNSFGVSNLKQDQLELGPFFSFFSFKNLKHQVGGRYLFAPDLFLPTISNRLYFGPHEVWLSYSEGFRNPSLADQFSQSPYSIGNPNLHPEKSKQWELGFVKKGKPVSFDLRIFHIQYEDFIDSIQVSPGVRSRQNQGEGYSQGLDFESNYQSFWGQAYVRYNFLDTKNRSTGQAFRLSPRHQITLGGYYKAPGFDIEAQNTHWYDTLDLDFVSNQNVDLEDWQQWNFFVHTNPMKSLRVSFGLINAFNEGKELTLNYPEPQRKYWLKARYQFGELL